MSPASTSNLVPFKPGQSGNPGGSSKKRRLEQALRRRLRSISDRDAYIDEGLKAIRARDPGWQTIYKEFMDRYDGPMPTVVQIEIAAAKVIDLGPVEQARVIDVVAEKVLELGAAEVDSDGVDG